ncbi:peroxiredoxin [Sphingomonas sp. ac-8]|uniref:peroxiredoxin n=1 Tax=Sphingomonas sp. ac-8 TaxID=3242977 RepID=UPI003A80832B
MRSILLVATLLLPFAAPAQAALAPGAKAPDFVAKGAIAGKPFTLHLRSQLRKGPVVLYFFPAAFTGGCNAEARAFAESVDAFRAAGATVIGMSADPIDRLERFSTQHCAGKFAVASATSRVIRGYDVALGRQIAGRAATSRTSYVIAPDGRILYAHDDASPIEHVQRTLAAVQAWHKDHAAHP